MDKSFSSIKILSIGMNFLLEIFLSLQNKYTFVAESPFCVSRISCQTQTQTHIPTQTPSPTSPPPPPPSPPPPYHHHHPVSLRESPPCTAAQQAQSHSAHNDSETELHERAAFSP